MEHYKKAIEVSSSEQLVDSGEQESAKICAAKAYMNMAQTKAMSSNHKQAIALCD